jgi:hypothetical protein
MMAGQEQGLTESDLGAWNGEAFNFGGADNYINTGLLSRADLAAPGDNATAAPALVPSAGFTAEEEKNFWTDTKPEETFSFSKMASDMWKTLTEDKATAAVTMAVISGAAKGVLDMMAADKTSRAATSLKQAEWANTDRVEAEKRKRIGSVPTLSRKAAYAPIAQNYSAPGLLNLNRGSV